MVTPRYQDAVIPDAYERLILDCIRCVWARVGGERGRGVACSGGAAGAPV